MITSRTSSNVASALVKLVAMEALPDLMGNLVMGNLVNRDYQPTLAQGGDTVSVPSLGNAQIVLNTHAEATFQVPDATKALLFRHLLKLYMQPAMVALAERIETDLLNTYALFTANNAVGTVGSPITEAVVDAAETQLFQSKVPASEPKYLVVDANTYAQLRQIERFSEYQTAGEAGLRALVDGTVGKIKDFFVFRSQFVAKTGSPVNTHNLAFTRSALGLVIRRLSQPLPGTGAIAEYADLGNFGLRVTLSYQPNTLAQQFTVDVLYGVAVLRNQFGVQVNS